MLGISNLVIFGTCKFPVPDTYSVWKIFIEVITMCDTGKWYSQSRRILSGVRFVKNQQNPTPFSFLPFN